MQAIQSAKIHYNDQGTPVSDLFGDVYFSNESGLEETQYVFLQQNGLPERWLHHPAAYFHIIETGFGTGLNFLLAWSNFRQALTQDPAMRCQRLYFSSFEKYPITKADLELALRQWPSLAPFAKQLLDLYPPALPGCHRLQLDGGRIILDLWLGDVHDSMPQLSSQHKADAWFLDGFAPSKNPQMWQPELFHQMARLSQPGCTLATFTSAGIVRRGLTEVGFEVKKIKGYGRKREMCVGTFATPLAHEASSGGTSKICIAGGGLASVCLALALIRRGRQVHLICKDPDIACGASHNRQGALYPQLQSTFSKVSAFHSHAFMFARRFYQSLHNDSFRFPHDFCGVLALACTEPLALRQQKISQLPVFTETMVQSLSSAQASEIAGVALPFAGMYFKEGGWIAPQLFCRAAIDYLQQQQGFSAQFDCELYGAEFQDNRGSWQLTTSQGVQHSAQFVVAMGAAITTLDATSNLPVNLVRGQVSHVRCEGMTGLKTVICHQGYITPADPVFTGQPEHCVGATFDRSRQQAIELEEDNQKNLALVNQVLQQPGWFHTPEVTSAKAGVRATLPDHLPLAGALDNNMWLLGGLGARGLLFAPILAEHIAAGMCGEPSPLAVEHSALVSAGRFSP